MALTLSFKLRILDLVNDAHQFDDLDVADHLLDDQIDLTGQIDSGTYSFSGDDPAIVVTPTDEISFFIIPDHQIKQETQQFPYDDPPPSIADPMEPSNPELIMI